MSTPMVVDDDLDFDAFDLEGYISDYTSRTRIERLLFIADAANGKGLELQAYRVALDLLKEGLDVAKYSQTIDKIGGRLGSSYALDEIWIKKTQEKCHRRREELEAQLRNFKAQMAKEGVRMGHNDLAAFHYECGQLQDALKEYAKMRDYCTTSKHSAMMCLNTMRVALEMKTVAHLAASLKRASQLPSETKTKLFQAQMHCYCGLKELEGKKYEAAATFFVQVDPELGNKFTDVMTVRDVSVYGGLCALATFSRADMKLKVISSVTFKELLELHPVIRDCVHAFYQCRYSECFSLLKRLKPMLLLDLYLHSHVEDLYQLIRQRALIQFTNPFTSISLHPMAKAFNVPMAVLQEELVGLISAKKVSARIDSAKQVLYSRQADVRKSSFTKAVSLTRRFLQENKALLVRLNLIKHDLMQKQLMQGDRRQKKTIGVDLPSDILT